MANWSYIADRAVNKKVDIDHRVIEFHKDITKLLYFH